MNNNSSLNHIKNTFTFQYDQSDCGVACLLSIIRYHGGDNTLERLRELSGTTRHGNTLLGLYQASCENGFNAEGYTANMESLIQSLENPIILHTTQDNIMNHYIVCYEYRKGKFTIGDPAKGILFYTAHELEEIWISHSCLVLAPNETFIKEKAKRKEKLKWILSLLIKDQEKIAVSIVLGVLIVVLGMAMVIFTQNLVDKLIPSGDSSKLITSIILLGIILAIRAILESIRNTLIIHQTRDFNNRITDKFYYSLLNLPKNFFDSRKTGEFIARINDTQRVQKVIVTIISNTTRNILVCLFSFLALFYYSFNIALISLLILPIYFLLVYSFNNRVIKTQYSVMQSYALSQSNYVTTLQGISEIKNNNCIPFFRKINKILYGKFQEENAVLGKINVSISIVADLFCIIFLIFILGYTSFLVVKRHMQIGELIAILNILASLLPTITELALITIPINEAYVAFTRMYEFASLKKEEKGCINNFNFNVLQIKNISFRFPGHQLILKDISLSIKNRECIAIIGESGCGKSTFIQILQKFYSYESGIITVNDSFSLVNIKLDFWRNIIGVIPQEIAIFNGNVVDNILLGQKCTPQELEEFTTKYNFQQFIASLPQGFATILGENGINLSGGQKQLIALMRVLWRKPQLLILDEFSSGMDSKTECFAISILNKLKQNMGILFVSHRIYSLKHIADRICILENGTISHCGTHEQLLRSHNFYSHYWMDIHK